MARNAGAIVTVAILWQGGATVGEIEHGAVGACASGVHNVARRVHAPRLRPCRRLYRHAVIISADSSCYCTSWAVHTIGSTGEARTPLERQRHP